jgi:hypothetical protein
MRHLRLAGHRPSAVRVGVGGARRRARLVTASFGPPGPRSPAQWRVPCPTVATPSASVRILLDWRDNFRTTGDGEAGTRQGRRGRWPRRRLPLRQSRRKAYRRSLASPVVSLPLSGLFLRMAWTNSANGRVREGRKGLPRRSPQGATLSPRRGQPLAWPTGASVLEWHRERLSAPIRCEPRPPGASTRGPWTAGGASS